RTLAVAVRPQHGDALPRAQRQRQVAQQRRGGFVADRQILKEDDVLTGGREIAKVELERPRLARLLYARLRVEVAAQARFLRLRPLRDLARITALRAVLRRVFLANGARHRLPGVGLQARGLDLLVAPLRPLAILFGAHRRRIVAVRALEH